MSTECEKESIRTLKQRLDDMEKLLDEKFKSRDLAIQKALESNESRLANMNEFRAQLNAERGAYALKDVIDVHFEGNRKEYIAKFDAMEAKIESIASSISENKGGKIQSRDTTATLSWLAPTLVSVIAIVTAIIALVHP